MKASKVYNCGICLTKGRVKVRIKAWRIGEYTVEGVNKLEQWKERYLQYLHNLQYNEQKQLHIKEKGWFQTFCLGQRIVYIRKNIRTRQDTTACC